VLVSDPIETPALRGLRLGDIDRFWVHWPADGSNVYGMGRGKVPAPLGMEFSAEQPGAPGTDFVAAGLRSLMSPRARSALLAAAVTGWDSVPCRLRLRDGTVLDYHLLIVHGRSGGLDFSHARTVELPPLRAGLRPRRRIVGYHPDMTRWDGRDIFFAGDTDVLCIIADAARRLAVHELTGIRFEDIDQPMIDLPQTIVGRPPTWSGE